MLKDAIREAARAAIQARFQLRDEVLIADLEKLASQARSIGSGDEMARIGVRVRLTCEHDLFERAHMVWNSLKRAHQDRGAPKSPTLMEDLMAESQHHMKQAGLNLAGSLERFSPSFAPLFVGRGGLDGRWLSGLCRRAIERYATNMEEYVAGVRWGLRSLVSSLRSGR